MKIAQPLKSRSISLMLAMVTLLVISIMQAPPCEAYDLFAPVTDYFANWFTRVDRTQAEQPHWMTPLVTVTPRLEEEYRYDQLWQSQPRGKALNNFGANKGLELIPAEPIEVILGVPGYIVQGGTGKKASGWADETFLIKYRLLAANEESGNYILSLFLGVSVPTGDDPMSFRETIYTPTIAFGKGWGNFDIQSTVAAALPDGGMNRLGSPILWNTTFQYHVEQFFLWPEVETNYTWWPNGERVGKSQLFLTPGVILGRFPIWNRLRFVIGAGYQVAVTKNPLYNNGVVFSVRTPF